MKASEINLQSQSKSNFSLFYTRHRYCAGLNLKFVKAGYSIENLLLNNKDVADLETWLNLNGIKGTYKYTKSAIWARCTNSLSIYQMIELTRWLMLNRKTIAFYIK